MPGRKRWVPLATTVAGLAMFLTADTASATTICVPEFTSSCPNSGGNKETGDVEEAISLDGSDGKADTVRIGPGTFTEDAGFEPEGAFASPQTYELNGTDPLTIVGAGPAATILTSMATGNVFVANLTLENSRAITMRDLTIRAPESMPDGEGALLALAGDTLENVDLVSRNKDTRGIAAEVGGENFFRDGEVRGEGPTGSVFSAFDAAGASNPSLVVEDSTARDASWALESSEVGSTLTARRVRVIGGHTYGIVATGGTVDAENSVFELTGGVGIYASSVGSPSSVEANHVTISSAGSSYPAIELVKTSGAAADTVTVSNSILQGFSSGFSIEAAAGPGIGQANLTARYSNIPFEGISTGNFPTLTGSIDKDPRFAADLSLQPGSPSIDAGDPAAGGPPADFAGAPRPVDGNGDGIAVQDQGAFEYQPPAPPREGSPADITPPQTKIVKGPGKGLANGEARFRFTASEPGSTFACKLDRRRPAGCKSPKRYRHLKPGRHLFRVWATDVAGNRDKTPAKRRFRVPNP